MFRCVKDGNKRRQGSTARAGLVSVLLSSLPVIGCSDPAPLPPTPAGVTLTIGYSHMTGEGQLHGIQQGSRLISREGLTLPNRDGRALPRLAESWSESVDGLTWTFTLRANALFHDGTPVDSNAVKRSLERSLASSDIQQYPGLADITLIETASPREVVVRLRQRSTFLLDDLGVSILKIEDGRPAIGTGPYVTVAGSGNELAMKAFERYYRGTPQIDQILWRAYPTVRTAWAAMMRGEIDLLYEVGPEVREFIEPEASVRVFPFLRNYNFAVVLNSRKKPFDKREVRRALNYAINRTHLVENALHGNGQETSGPVWPLHWAYDRSVAGYEYDPSRSIALLDSVDIPRVVRVANAATIPSRFAFTCLIPQSFALWERMTLIVQRDLARIGVDMQIESVPFEEFNRRIAAGDFDAVTLEFIFGNSPTRPYTFWYSTSKQNMWGYRSAAVDGSLDRIRRAATENEYREALRQFQIDTLDDPPAIFLAISQTARAVSRRFNVVAPPGSDILPTIGDWRPANRVETEN